MKRNVKRGPPSFPVMSLHQNSDQPGPRSFSNPATIHSLRPASIMSRTRIRLIELLSAQLPGHSDDFWRQVVEIVDIALRNECLLENVNVDDDVRRSWSHSTADAINPAMLSLHPAVGEQDGNGADLRAASLRAQSHSPLPDASHEVSALLSNAAFLDVRNFHGSMLPDRCVDLDDQCPSFASSVDLGLYRPDNAWSDSAPMSISPECQSNCSNPVHDPMSEDSTRQIGDANTTAPSGSGPTNGRDLTPTQSISARTDRPVPESDSNPEDHVDWANNTLQTCLTAIRSSKRKRSTPVNKAIPGPAKTVQGDCIPLSVVRARFKEFEANIEDIPLVVGLLNHIGAPETICQLKDACSIARKASCSTSDQDITCSIRAIDDLGKELVRVPMLRRYHIRRLVQHLNEEIDKLVTTDGRDSKAATTSILKALMRKTYPGLSESNSNYAKTYKRLVQQTSHARHWYALQQEFSVGVLAVIPSPELIGFPLNKMEKLRKPASQAFLSLLVEYRGDFIRTISSRLSGVFDVLLRKESASRFKFECISDVDDIPRDSKQLLELCTTEGSRIDSPAL